jgi:hypothetical protein
MRNFAHRRSIYEFQMAAAELITTRILPDDLRRLRLIAAATDQRLYEVLSRLLTTETTRLSLERDRQDQHGGRP